MAIKDVSVVLAHGAWADGSSWARVITALKAEAVKVSAAPLPLTSLADDVTADVETEDLLRLPFGVVGAVGELDAAGFPPPARQHLRLDDDLAAELLRRRARLLRTGRGPPLGHGDPEAREELLSLILIEIHPGAGESSDSAVAFRRHPREE